MNRKLYNWEHLSLIFFLFFISHSSGRLFSFGDCSFHFQAMVLVLHEGFFHLEIVASSSSHGSNFTRDTSNNLVSNCSNLSSSSVDETRHEMFANMDRQR